MRCFELVRTDSAEMAMAARQIVEPLDVLGDVRGRYLPTGVDALLDPLLLQAAEEGLSDRVVPAVGTSAHAWLKVVVFAETSPCITSVLRALIRVDKGFARTSAAHGFHHGIQNKFSMNR